MWRTLATTRPDMRRSVFVAPGRGPHHAEPARAAEQLHRGHACRTGPRAGRAGGLRGPARIDRDRRGPGLCAARTSRTQAARCRRASRPERGAGDALPAADPAAARCRCRWCVLNGVAAGAGASLALACDVIYAVESARFVQAFSKIGLLPDAGGTWFLPRLVGSARAMGAALFGESVSARQAEAWGLIWRAVPDEALAATLAEIEATLAAGPTRCAAAQALHASSAIRWRSSSTWKPGCSASWIHRRLPGRHARLRRKASAGVHRDLGAAFALRGSCRLRPGCLSLRSPSLGSLRPCRRSPQPASWRQRAAAEARTASSGRAVSPDSSRDSCICAISSRAAGRASMSRSSSLRSRTTRVRPARPRAGLAGAVAPCGRIRNHAHADACLHHAADGIEAVELDALGQALAGHFQLFAQEGHQRGAFVHGDEGMADGLGQLDLGAVLQGWPLGVTSTRRSVLKWMACNSGASTGPPRCPGRWCRRARRARCRASAAAGPRSRPDARPGSGPAGRA